MPEIDPLDLSLFDGPHGKNLKDGYHKAEGNLYMWHGCTEAALHKGPLGNWEVIEKTGQVRLASPYYIYLVGGHKKMVE